MTFSRIEQPASSNESATEIFMPVNKFHSNEQSWRKQFAFFLINKEAYRYIIHVPAQFHQDPHGRTNPSATAVIEVEEDGAWLERNRFVDREVELEELFHVWIKISLLEFYFHDTPENNGELLFFRIYSRKIERLRLD